jgi:hypothetical protein
MNKSNKDGFDKLAFAIPGSYYRNNPTAKDQFRTRTEPISVTDNSFNLGKGVSGAQFMSDFGYGAANAVMDKAGYLISKRINDKQNTNMNKYSNNGGGSDGGGRKGRKRGGKGNNSKSNPLLLPKERATASLSFDSGIRSGLVVDTHNSGNTNHSPCFILGGALIPLSLGNDCLVDQQFSTSLYFQYLRECQTMVNYAVGSKFTEGDFKNYMRSIIRALQVYYMVDSILAYCDNRYTVKNEGLFNLRQTLGADELSKHREIELALGGLACPPRLLNFIRYMYQNFTFSEEDNTSIHRLTYSSSFRGVNFGVDSNLFQLQEEILRDLRDPAYVGDTPGILAKAFPSWTLNILPPSSMDPIYDPGFRTFWYNSTSIYQTSDQSTSFSYTSTASTNSSSKVIHSFTNDLDGIYYAMICTRVNEPGVECTQTGLWIPTSDFSTDADNRVNSSLLCYRDEAPLQDWKAPVDNRLGAQSGMRHVAEFATGTATANLRVYTDPQAIKIQYSSVDNQSEVVANTMDWLFSTQQ